MADASIGILQILSFYFKLTFNVAEAAHKIWEVEVKKNI